MNQQFLVPILTVRCKTDQCYTDKLLYNLVQIVVYQSLYSKIDSLTLMI